MVSGNSARVEPPITFRTYCICAFAAFGGILFGYDSGYISGVLAMNWFKLTFGEPGSTDLTAYNGYMYETWQKSLVTSILSAGTFFGALISGSVADWLGRRITIILGCLIYIVGVILQVAASSVGLLVAGRAVAGIGVGFVSAIVILYAGEISPKSIRGTVLSGYQFAITVGLLVASGIDQGTHDRLDSGSYRIPIALQFLWAIMLAVGLTLLPESPRWYIRAKMPEKAADSLAILRGHSTESAYVQDELNELIANYQVESGLCEGGWVDCFKGGWKPGSNLRRVLLGITIQMMQQFTGVNFIFYYGTTFFKQAGLSNAFLITIITSIVNVCSTPISFWTIERWGRRPLLIWGAVGMCISQFIIAVMGTMAAGQNSSGIVLIVFVCTYIFFFASTWGPTGWAVCSEIFPLPIRSKAVALSTASNWLWNFVIGYTTPYLVDKDKGNLGSKVFFIWGSCCAAGVMYAYFFVPETKGMSLEQVDIMMVQCSPRKSAGWKCGQDIEMAPQVVKIEEQSGVTPKASHESYE